MLNLYKKNTKYQVSKICVYFAVKYNSLFCAGRLSRLLINIQSKLTSFFTKSNFLFAVKIKYLFLSATLNFRFIPICTKLAFGNKFVTNHTPIAKISP